jgi:hypothetical protein
MFVEEEPAATAMPDRKSLDFRLITITRYGASAIRVLPNDRLRHSGL